VDVLEPAFVKNFSCAGGGCPDHCCHTWEVFVDKKSFKSLKKIGDIVVKQLANSNLKLTRISETNYATIKMDEKSMCPFLDSENLCQIHKRCGHQALPHTCQDYPRVFNWFGEQIESSLSLSCPSAAKEILFNPAAMMFDAKKYNPSQLNHGNIGGLIHQQLPDWLSIIREFCFAVILDEKLDLSTKLFMIGLFLKQSEEHLDNIPRLQQLIVSMAEMAQDGTIAKLFATLPVEPLLKWKLFASQDAQLSFNRPIIKEREETEGLSLSDFRFNQCRMQLFSLLKENESTLAVSLRESKDSQIEILKHNVKFFESILSKAQKNTLNQYFDENPQIMLNYLIYYFYHYQFMIREDKSPFQFFKILVVDLMMLKSYLSGIAIKQGKLTDEWLLQLFQSYARQRQHQSSFIAGLEAQLNNAHINNPGAIFGVLK